MNPTPPPILRAWVAEPLEPEVQAMLQRLMAAPDVRYIAVMPDVHKANDVCVGTVLATSRLIYLAAVGGDIGCGVAAIAFDGAADALADESVAAELLSGLYRVVPPVRHGRHRTAAPIPPALAETPLSNESLQALRRRDGQVQFATLGRGNHFLEFQSDEEGRLWLMVHSGSRAMGQAIRDRHVAAAQAHSGGLKFLDAESAGGKAYLSDMNWARAYAAANRRAMIDAAAGFIGDLLGQHSVESSFINCDHNHVARETHFGQELWIHRKGAMPAADGQDGLIPGSMGTCSYIVHGRGCTESLRSSSHGAGRAMSRHRARGKTTARDLLRQMRGIWFDQRLSGQLRDEAPSAYKDIRAVMRAQQELTCIVRCLKPVLYYKGV